MLWPQTGAILPQTGALLPIMRDERPAPIGCLVCLGGGIGKHSANYCSSHPRVLIILCPSIFSGVIGTPRHKGIMPAYTAKTKGLM